MWLVIGIGGLGTLRADYDYDQDHDDCGKQHVFTPLLEYAGIFPVKRVAVPDFERVLLSRASVCSIWTFEIFPPETLRS